MFASLRRMPVMFVCTVVAVLSAAALLSSCGADGSSRTSAASGSTSAQNRPPEWVASYVSQATKQFGQAESVEWVWRASQPEAKDLNGGVMVGLQLLDRGAKQIGGWAFFGDYAATTPVRSLGYYIVAAQGHFVAPPDHHAPPVPGNTVLLLLAAVRVAGHDTFQTAEAGVYSESVHLDMEGTRVYVEGMGPADVPIDWLNSSP